MHIGYKLAVSAAAAILAAVGFGVGWHALTPTVAAMTPPDGADMVYPGASLAVSFSQPMERATVTAGAIGLFRSDGTRVPVEISYDVARRIAAVTPQAQLKLGDTYELRIGAEGQAQMQSRIGLSLPDHATSRFRMAHPLIPPHRPHAPILLVTDEQNSFADYYAEILQTEGLNLFSTVDMSALTPEDLASADLVILTASPRSTAISAAIEAWVRSGGNVIAFEPKGEFLSLFGLRSSGESMATGYLQANPESPAARGIVQESLQLHVPARRYTLDDATVVAKLLSTATQPLDNPAIALRKVGHGHAAAYAYDLARSIVRTRQGNPEWINQDRDGIPPRRTNDLFYPDDIDMTKVGIPQADEQQRLFANLILTMTVDKRPLPRFWYLPKGLRAALIMASDDHATKRGTLDAFAKLQAASAPGCRIEDWECYRASSYLTPATRQRPEALKPFIAEGFELGTHVDTGCEDQSNLVIDVALAEQIGQYGTKRMGFDKQRTHRIHCIVWNGWTDTAKSERTMGIRLSLDYYYWPHSWIGDRPGYINGSGMPMRFADLDGSVLDIYQAPSHLVNENGLDHRKSVEFLIDRALGPEQFFGAFGTHYDYSDNFFDVLLEVAKERGVPLISAAQMLHWLDARAQSHFDDLAWDGQTLDFEVTVGTDAPSMIALLPSTSSGRRISSVTCAGRQISFRSETIKGLGYATFPVKSGSCSAVYASRSTTSEATVP